MNGADRIYCINSDASEDCTYVGVTDGIRIVGYGSLSNWYSKLEAPDIVATGYASVNSYACGLSIYRKCYDDPILDICADRLGVTSMNFNWCH